MDNERIVDKIKKLLAKADSNKNSNEHEVEAAALMAQRLMAKYGVDVDEIDLQEMQEIVTGELNISKHRSWKYRLSGVIADNFRCKKYFTTRKGSCKLKFIGQKHDVAIANEMYVFLYKIGHRNASKLEKKIREECGTAKGVYISYTEGFVNGLREKLEEQCRALMIITLPEVEAEYQEIAKGFEGKGLRTRTTDKFNQKAYVQGKYDGKYSLNRTEFSDQHKIQKESRNNKSVMEKFDEIEGKWIPLNFFKAWLEKSGFRTVHIGENDGDLEFNIMGSRIYRITLTDHKSYDPNLNASDTYLVKSIDLVS